MVDLRLADGPHVFVDDLSAPVLSDVDHHHLSRSLRLRDGDPCTLSDGAGRWVQARFARQPETDSEPHVVAAPIYGIAVGIALTKATKPETVVQKATELGVDRIVVFRSQHSVPRWDADKRASQMVRLERIAREAAMQSRRVRLPQIEVVATLDAALVSSGEMGLTPQRADFGGTPIDRDVRFVLVGPEGGWSTAERERVPDAVDLGPTVLRAETAAIVAAGQMARCRWLGSLG